MTLARRWGKEAKDLIVFGPDLHVSLNQVVVAVRGALGLEPPGRVLSARDRADFLAAMEIVYGRERRLRLAEWEEMVRGGLCRYSNPDLTSIAGGVRLKPPVIVGADVDWRTLNRRRLEASERRIDEWARNRKAKTTPQSSRARAPTALKVR